MTIDRRRSKHMPPLGHLVPSPERPRDGAPVRQEFPESHDVFRAEFPDVGRSRMRGLPYYPYLYFFPTSPQSGRPESAATGNGRRSRGYSVARLVSHSGFCFVSLAPNGIHLV